MKFLLNVNKQEFEEMMQQQGYDDPERFMEQVLQLDDPPCALVGATIKMLYD